MGAAFTNTLISINLITFFKHTWLHITRTQAQGLLLMFIVCHIAVRVFLIRRFIVSYFGWNTWPEVGAQLSYVNILLITSKRTYGNLLMK